MNNQVEELQKYSKSQLEAVSAASSAVVKGLQQIGEETAAYSKKHFETSSAALQELFGAKSLDKAIEIQTTFAKQAYENFVAQTTKVGKLYTDLVKDAVTPVKEAFSKSESAQTALQPVASKTKTAA